MTICYARSIFRFIYFHPREGLLTHIIMYCQIVQPKTKHFHDFLGISFCPLACRIQGDSGQKTQLEEKNWPAYQVIQAVSQLHQNPRPSLGREFEKEPNSFLVLADPETFRQSCPSGHYSILHKIYEWGLH